MYDSVEIKVGEKKKMYFFFVGSMLKKSEVESLDECVLLEWDTDSFFF